MIDQNLYEQFRDVGRDIYVGQLTTSHGGNMSVRLGDRLVIKRSGARLGQLHLGDFVELLIDGVDPETGGASSDLLVHRAVYQHTPALAVIHAHLRTATALSLSRDEIVPVDVTGQYLFGRIPVVAALYPATQEMAAEVAETLRDHRIVMLRGHGCVSTGQTLDEAFKWLSALEEVSDIILRDALIRLSR